MKPNLESQIRGKLADFVTGSLALDELQEWLAPLVWDIEDEGDQECCDLIYAAELALAEYSAGHLSERDFVSAIESLVLYQPSSSTSDSSNQVSGDPAARRLLDDTQYAVESASSNLC